MATAYLLEWQLVTRAQYDTLVCELHWEAQAGSDRISFEGGRGRGRLAIIETWDTQEAFYHFWNQKLLPALLTAGMQVPFIQTWAVPQLPPAPHRQPDLTLDPLPILYECPAWRIPGCLNLHQVRN